MDVEIYQKAIRSLKPDAILEDQEGVSYPVHSFLLSACSPVFRAMFQSEMKEGLEKVIEVKFPPETLRSFLCTLCDSPAEEGSLGSSEKDKSGEDGPSLEEELSRDFSLVQFYDHYEIDAKHLQRQILDYVTEDNIMEVLKMYFVFSNSNVDLLHALVRRLKEYLTFNHKLMLFYENSKYCIATLSSHKRRLTAENNSGIQIFYNLIGSLIQEHDVLSCQPILVESQEEDTKTYYIGMSMEEKRTFSSVNDFLQICGLEKAWLLRMKWLYISIKDYEKLWDLPLEKETLQILFERYEPIFPIFPDPPKREDFYESRPLGLCTPIEGSHILDPSHEVRCPH